MRIAGLLALGLMLGGCAKSVDDWRRDLHDEDPYARLMAVVALGETGRSDVAPDLLAALSDTSETVRAAALESLRALGPAAAPALLQRLELGATTPADEDPARQARLVASVLVDQGLTSSAPLIQALQDDRYDRQAIVEALAAAGPSIVGPLGELLLQPQPGVAAAAASALGSLGEQALSSVTSLVLALRRPEPEVTRAAAGALGRIAPDRSDVLPALLQVARAPGADDDSERAAAIAEARRAAVRGLLLRMASGQPPLQEQALAQMADLGPIAIEGLIHALKFDDDAVADEAADCLATLGPGVLPPLLSSLGERNPRHIERGAQVVARIGPPALEPLLAIIAEPEHRDRVRATTALAGLGAGAGPAWPALLALLDDPSPKMPLAAALTLGRLSPPDDASLDALLAAHARQSAMVSRLLLPALVRGLVLRIAPGTPDGAARLDQLRGLGPDAVGELGRLRDDPDPGLSAAAGRVAALLASP